MAVYSKSHPLIDSYWDYAYEATTKRLSKGNENRYIINPFILRFSILLQYVLCGLIVENKQSSRENATSKCIELEAIDPHSITGLTPEMYVIRGRTNKKIVSDFLQFRADGNERFWTQEEIGDYIYLVHQKKRKYRSDCTLEEIIDFMNFSGDSLGSILLRRNEIIRTSVIHYINVSDIPVLDKLELLKDTTFPAFAVPAYGIMVCIRVRTKHSVLSGSTDQESRNSFSFLCSDPLDAVKSSIKDELFGQDYFRSGISAIQDTYRTLIDLFSRDATNNPLKDDSASRKLNVFGGIDDLALLQNSGWYKELMIYRDERRQADMATRLEDKQMASQKALEACLRKQSAKKSLSDLMGSI